jgi:hypothetical protein
MGASTYSSGTSKLQVFIDGAKVWEEDAGAPTEIKQASFECITAEEGQTVVIKISNTADMTGGYLNVNYDEKDSPLLTAF